MKRKFTKYPIMSSKQPTRKVIASDYNWPEAAFWESLDLDDDFDEFQDAEFDYLNDLNIDVFEELGVEVIDASGQSGYGEIVLGKNGARVTVDLEEFNDTELAIARTSASAEAYKQGFRQYIQNLWG